MPATTADTSPDPLDETWDHEPWSPHHHTPGTGSHDGRCDVPSCTAEATQTVHVHRNGLIARSHARCETHTPPRGHVRAGKPSPDPQRPLIYKAEECRSTLARDQHAATLPIPVLAAQQIVDDTVASRWWDSHATEPGPITVTNARRARADGAASPGQIAITSNASTWTLVHELAHHAAGFDGEPHGPRFARRLLDLHAIVHDATVARLLRDAFDTVGVHYLQAR